MNVTTATTETKTATTATAAGPDETHAPGGEVAALLEEMRAVAEEARAAFGGLNARQLNWKPSPERWGVGQCFDHVIRANRAFVPVLERVARGEHRMSAWERRSPLSGLFGRLILKSLAPDSGRKFKAPQGVRPASSDVDARVISTFAAQQAELVGLVARAAAAADPRKTIVTSPIARLVTYSLGDALRILVTHERRHSEQARRVTEAEGFPR
ncbi:MAG TPA: DinB family protein [Pyrinomonadaceae bacterium]|nr:DinB family protein [Pyrinomonadaceae bacterium]